MVFFIYPSKVNALNIKTIIGTILTLSIDKPCIDIHTVNALFLRMPIFANRSSPPTDEFFVIVFLANSYNIGAHHTCTFTVYNSLQIFANGILFAKIRR